MEQDPGPAVDRVAARRADALLALATGEVQDDIADDASAPAVACGRAQVIVHIDAGSGSARIDGGPELAPSTAERLACDARVQLLLGDRTTNRLYLGRQRRLATPAQIAALTARDGARCQFPGCSHTRHLHAHHVLPWLRGRHTDIDYLVLLCGYHQRVIHDHGYRIRRLPDRWEVRRPDGNPVPVTGAALTGNVERLIEIDTRGPAADRPRLPHPGLGRRTPRPRTDPRRPAAPPVQGGRVTRPASRGTVPRARSAGTFRGTWRSLLPRSPGRRPSGLRRARGDARFRPNLGHPAGWSHTPQRANPTRHAARPPPSGRDARQARPIAAELIDNVVEGIRPAPTGTPGVP